MQQSTTTTTAAFAMLILAVALGKHGAAAEYCQGCAAGFQANGGCETEPNSDEAKAAVPEGCTSCPILVSRLCDNGQYKLNINTSDCQTCVAGFDANGGCEENPDSDKWWAAIPEDCLDHDGDLEGWNAACPAELQAMGFCEAKAAAEATEAPTAEPTTELDVPTTTAKPSARGVDTTTEEPSTATEVPRTTVAPSTTTLAETTTTFLTSATTTSVDTTTSDPPPSTEAPTTTKAKPAWLGWIVGMLPYEAPDATTTTAAAAATTTEAPTTPKSEPTTAEAKIVATTAEAKLNAAAADVNGGRGAKGAKNGGGSASKGGKGGAAPTAEGKQGDADEDTTISDVDSTTTTEAPTTTKAEPTTAEAKIVATTHYQDCPGGVLYNFEEPILSKKRKVASLSVIDEVENAYACAQACNDVGTGCAAFVYRGTNLKCRLFDTDGGLSDTGDDTSVYYLRVQKCRTPSTDNQQSTAKETTDNQQSTAAVGTVVDTTTTTVDPDADVDREAQQEDKLTGGGGGGGNNGKSAKALKGKKGHKGGKGSKGGAPTASQSQADGGGLTITLNKQDAPAATHGKAKKAKGSAWMLKQSQAAQDRAGVGAAVVLVGMIGFVALIATKTLRGDSAGDSAIDNYIVPVTESPRRDQKGYNDLGSEDEPEHSNFPTERTTLLSKVRKSAPQTSPQKRKV